MSSNEVLCDLDSTWIAVDNEYKDVFEHDESNWSCHMLNGLDREVILSAPEVMDVKTDTGVGCESVYSLDYLIETKDISLFKSLIKEKSTNIIDLIDYIHLRELTYLQGYSPVQSYLNFPYFLRMQALKDENYIVYLYCKALLKCVEYTSRAIFSTNIRTDEEFSLVPPEMVAQGSEDVTVLISELHEAVRVLEIAVHDETHHTNAELLECPNVDNARKNIISFIKTIDKEDIVKLIARLQFRRNYLRMLHLFIDHATQNATEEANKISKNIVQMLQDTSLFNTRVDRVLRVDKSLIRDKEVSYWVNLFTPSQEHVSASFHDAIQTYITMFTHYSQLVCLYKTDLLLSGRNTHYLCALREFIERFASQSPLLPVRAIAVILLLNNDPGISFMGGPPLNVQILQTLSVHYGAPLYLKVYNSEFKSTANHAHSQRHQPDHETQERISRRGEDDVVVGSSSSSSSSSSINDINDKDVVEHIVKYRIQKTMSDPLKVTSNQIHYLTQQTVSSINKWSHEAATQYLLHIENMLCNRGLCHRKLMNNINSLQQFVEHSYFVDATIFTSNIPGVPRDEEDGNNDETDPLVGNSKKISKQNKRDSRYEDCIRCSNVLTAVANSYLLHTMKLILELQFELQLYNNAELLPSLWYCNYIERVSIENLSVLMLTTTTFLPQQRINKKSKVPLYNLALTSRTRGTLDALMINYMDSNRMLADVMLLSGCVFDALNLINLHVFESSYHLTTAAEMFNHRMLKAFGAVRNPPFVPYSAIMQSLPKLKRTKLMANGNSDAVSVLSDNTANPNAILLSSRKVCEVSSQIIEKCKNIIANHPKVGSVGSAAFNSSFNVADVNVLLHTVIGMEKMAKAINTTMIVFEELYKDATSRSIETKESIEGNNDVVNSNNNTEVTEATSNDIENGNKNDNISDEYCVKVEQPSLAQWIAFVLHKRQKEIK